MHSLENDRNVVIKPADKGRQLSSGTGWITWKKLKKNWQL